MTTLLQLGVHLRILLLPFTVLLQNKHTILAENGGLKIAIKVEKFSKCLGWLIKYIR